jgi:hypothetical protein
VKPDGSSRLDGYLTPLMIDTNWRPAAVSGAPWP